MPVIQSVQTRTGLARLTTEGTGPATLVLGHGAGGGIEAPDLVAARAAALALGLRVVRVEQPWRVAGRRIAVAPARLDEAWLDVCAALDGPLIAGGRSAGARVACRTAAATGAVGVLCLAFPLVPPGRSASRAAELLLPTVPTLVIQGSRDGFGVPLGACVVDGADHAFALRLKDGRTTDEVALQIQELVSGWLGMLSGLAPSG